jgi:hypothetical protein
MFIIYNNRNLNNGVWSIVDNCIIADMNELLNRIYCF